MKYKENENKHKCNAEQLYILIMECYHVKYFMSKSNSSLIAACTVHSCCTYLVRIDLYFGWTDWWFEHKCEFFWLAVSSLFLSFDHTRPWLNLHTWTRKIKSAITFL